jgi:hypothetical protein
VKCETEAFSSHTFFQGFRTTGHRSAFPNIKNLTIQHSSFNAVPWSATPLPEYFKASFLQPTQAVRTGGAFQRPGRCPLVCTAVSNAKILDLQGSDSSSKRAVEAPKQAAGPAGNLPQMISAGRVLSGSRMYLQDPESREAESVYSVGQILERGNPTPSFLNGCYCHTHAFWKSPESS